jgi:ribosomal protein L36
VQQHKEENADPEALHTKVGSNHPIMVISTQKLSLRECKVIKRSTKVKVLKAQKSFPRECRVEKRSTEVKVLNTQKSFLRECGVKSQSTFKIESYIHLHFDISLVLPLRQPVCNSVIQNAT